ncbi:hypothetical protein MLD38_022769 [Melastoma candidum]|uniref:Uncharacterized protein n=1 Tax=Melastoma candidum TaxID=119954 RepID=A0ACB9QPB3_9MYRT|nr:hypothetical protein MLD38_022769 [Melastoma candidum]
MVRLPWSNNGVQPGLLCHYLLQNGSSQCVMLDIVNHHGFGGNEVFVNQLYSFCTNVNIHICARCDHVLLLATFAGNSVGYHLYDVLERNCVPLPPPEVTKHSIRTGLAFDGQHSLVVRVFGVETKEVVEVEVEVFSSGTGAWSRCWPGIHLPRGWDLPKLGSAPLYLDGAIHWEMGGYLLSYHVDDGRCQLIELPDYSPNDWSCHTMTFGQCLWESKGILHYCSSNLEGIHIWALPNDPPASSPWKSVRSIQHVMLVSSNPEIFFGIERQQNMLNHCFSLQPCHISPFGYSPTTDAIYLRLPGAIISYDLSASILDVVCTFDTTSGQSFGCCIFPLDYRNPGGVSTMGRYGGGGKEQTVHLPLPDLVEKDSCK